MFDSIAPRYDLLNRLLSFRRDIAWRRRLANSVARHRCQRVLDLATGTGDVLLALAQNNAAHLAVGIDLAPEMLARAQQKLAKLKAPQTFSTIQADAQITSFQNNSFDAATIAFGIRNVQNVSQTLREIIRVLKPGGRLFVLEFSLPANPLLRAIYLAYFRYAVPAIGGWIARNRAAYAYLNQSVEAFPYGPKFCALLSAAGLIDVSFESLTFGVAAIYQGVKSCG
ncbi:MAG: bifunctional demethylmenaquinone methyltransferase/2-methoxy-6-polyprenyl-1,4-benzoquinol methylase UbiE [Candidatus Hydrogenedentes bacterium]|nr:bifunctional demethylmenaquinone methyltransferase/2-methoxy-6-polyprenyl-1,4-benzoquinol methylase UbiE [Candidatus Hydrogenedentota bacterium]